MCIRDSYIRGGSYSSRRSSVDKKGSTSELQRPSDVLETSLDKKMLEDDNNNNNSNNEVPENLDMSPAQRRTSLFGPRYDRAMSGEFSTPRASLTDEKSRLSVTSNTDSMGSHGSNMNLELEPLLTPRSLYMPWPTATVRAFAEFFYTGQVNSKWMLAPVVLDLFCLLYTSRCV